MASDQRADRLNRVFRKMLSGEQQVKSTRDAQHFLEAIAIQQPPSSCVERLVSSQHGLDSLRQAIRMDLSEPFILSQTLPFLQYLSDPTIKTLVDGQFLRTILEIVGNPPTVWNTLLQLFRNRKIPETQVPPFAWLASELLSLPSRSEIDVLKDVQAILERFLGAQQHQTRELGYAIQRALQLRSSSVQPGADGPGGRHDNDHEDFRKIRIYPTADEFLSTRRPFYLTAQEVLETDTKQRVGVHLANQFRLLREDMVAELREDHQVATGAKKGNRQSLILGNLRPIRLDFGGEDDGVQKKPFKKCTLLLQCWDGIHFQKSATAEARRKYLKDKPQILRHQAFGVLCKGNDIIAFAFVDRDIDRLSQKPSILSLRFTDSQGLRDALLALMMPNFMSVRFVLVDTAVFAYEPVLVGLQGLSQLALQDMLVNPALADCAQDVSHSLRLNRKIEQLRRIGEGTSANGGSVDLQVSGTKTITVDQSQLAALLHALTKPVSLIQGPPGTGKSFVGAIIAKLLFDSGKRILVVSYTNHALDQFLEDLLKAGIPEGEVVRIGAKAKCTPATLPLLLSEQKGGYRRSRFAWDLVDHLRTRARASIGQTIKSFNDCRQPLNWEVLSEYLEFSDEDAHFYDAFRLPLSKDNWQLAGKRKQKIGPDYLYQQWVKGKGPGAYGKSFSAESESVWMMHQSERQAHVERWTKNLLGERLQAFQEHVRRFDDIQEDIDTQFSEADSFTMNQKKIIGCTTTGAAKYSRLIRAARPDVVLVEEAGEILEGHILTALAPSVTQLILIGDHKQLRPKVNNYALSVEKGDGFDLNRSLFERLIIQGASHKTLHKQHRMIPEISRFPRELTYPGLVDGPGTSGRPAIRGLRDRVVFLNHGKPEASDQRLSERRDPDVKESKQNPFEADMIIRCVKYFGQQGYSSHNIVILTPYLGQLRLLQDLLRKNEHDPELSEMDKRDLIRAGLSSEASAMLDRKPLRLSTIDNYQGEESDIVIASLTRSNEAGAIGFMSAPERLNVLITRARNCLVLIGNMTTFMNSKRGSTTWRPFFEILNTHGHLYDGLPVKCEKHPQTTALLREPPDFDKLCPDGGCTEPCEAVLKCGIHKCKSRCHRVTDHSQAECHQPVDRVCERQHPTRVTCGRRSERCKKCIEEDKDQERRIKRDLELEKERLRRQEAYAKELQALDDEIDHERRLAKYKVEEEDQKKTIEQRQADLASIKETQKRMQEQEQRRKSLAAKAAARAEAAEKSAPAPNPDSDAGFDYPQDSKAEWEHLKRFDGAQSAPMDDLMAMIGLEDVKQEFLVIKSRVDLTLRQGTSLASERFSCSMLGNPGTGKTTVARIYAKFLTEVGVIPGMCFKETTGAGLANLGVSGCKKLIDEILNEGGGVLFLDEAYQLTSGNNPGGGAVLDYLLAEVENLCGKVFFVLAGYNKQMESFFAHNPGLPSRFPIQMDFADYTDDELLRILELKINKRFNGLLDCEDGLRGLYCRIVSRRIGYGRGKDGFGNARTVENTLGLICKRQADRVRRERMSGNKPDDMFLTKEDLIGPEPTDALTNCEAWTTLQELTGLSAVKEAVKALVDSVQQNYQRELAEQPPIQYSLNKVFLGNPGTGKTTVAKLYGQILVALGLLSRGEVVPKNPSDFVGAALGQSEQNTKGILASAIGKVLVIDEAYGLYGGDNQGPSSDPYKTAVIDTIVAEVQSVPGDDRCVLLLGYKDQMETMFQNVNPGLSRRFPIASGFQFDDFTQEELRKILDLKLKKQGYQVTEQAARVAMEMLDRARNRPNFGNAGEIDILLDATKARHQRRISRNKRGKGPKEPTQTNTLLEAHDFDENFDRAERSETNIRALFHDTVGSEQIVGLLESYQETVRTLKSLDMDPKENIPFNFLFRGPPGTGKTTTAKKMGKVFYDMGFLATADVEECSATDLIGQYVGQTGPKVQNLLDKALGRVLFVDEAYRLAEGHFAKEAMDEIVDSVTKPRYHKKLIIILAGYDADINRLMSVNAGLTSRFPAVIDFRALTPEECVSLLLQILQKQRSSLRSKGKEFDLGCLESPTKAFRQRIISDLEILAAQDNWASARDVQSLAREMFNKALRSKTGQPDGRLVLSEDIVRDELQAMLTERKSRSESTTPKLPESLEKLLQREPPAPIPPKMTRSHATAIKAQIGETRTEEAPPEEQAETQREEEKQDSRHLHDAQRDAGVSDAVWEQLQRDRKAEEEREAEYQSLKEAARTASDAAREQIVKRLIEEERKRKEEEERKKRLTELGRCPAGFGWIKQSGGYRCGGGSHFMSDKEVEAL
ncbi:P-loop containing nucleoside triphosphate hydrolase protein [Cercophora newfieldiana]|uniref:P-loop containing nucleoside triphosphate hydrolase protein n=1 Tax=Cercophora newfieldiana TaxID=92897 RepID=A0AA40CN80_9PEZI|nr:P-loop containing nucleoside triphosphate hydrolase protein [Cercophora newfieldiana]